MKTAYIAIVSASSAGMAAYLTPTHPYWVVITVPTLIVLSIHCATYVRQVMRQKRRIADTRTLMGEECPVCGVGEVEVISDNMIRCDCCATTFVVATDGLVDRRYPRQGIN